MKTSKNIASVEIEAVIIRADGTRENLGVISKSNKSNIVREVWKRLGGKS
jgi:hypothetical protein